MKVKFEREYLLMLASFMAIKDVRSYLNGFHVIGHPDGGVILSATDGHRLVTIHDKNGQSDGEYILPISKKLLAAAKKSNINGLPLNSIQFIDNKSYVLFWADDEEFDFFKNDEESPMEQVFYVEYVSQIKGNYPNTKRIFDGIKLEPVNSIGVNVGYIGKLKAVCRSSKSPCLKLFFSGINGSIISVSGRDEEIVSIIMAARVGEDEHEELTIPSFVNFGGGQSEKEKEG